MPSSRLTVAIIIVVTVAAIATVVIAAAAAAVVVVVVGAAYNHMQKHNYNFIVYKCHGDNICHSNDTFQLVTGRHRYCCHGTILLS